jgi:fibronectin type 3 domain-containing protein
MRRRTTGAAAVAAALSTLASTAGAAVPALADAAPGQDVLNDWGQTADQVAAEITAAVDTDATVVAARARYDAALPAYSAAVTAAAAAYDAYLAAKKTAPTSDDAAALATYNKAKQAKLDAAAEIVASQLAMEQTVAKITAAIKARHYIQAPVVVRPGKVVGVAVAAGDSQVALSWPEVSGATTYRVYRDGAEIARVASPAYTDTGLINTTTYSYTVMATNVAGWGPLSAVSLATPDTGIPSPASNLGATPGDGRVVLTWTAVAGVTGYRVYRDNALIASPAGTTYTDTGLVNGTSYSYTVVSVNGSRASSPSPAVDVVPVAAAPSAPTGLAVAVGDASLSLTWTTPTGATGYRVYRDNVLVASPSTASWTDTGVTNGTSYAYRVAAVRQNSAESAKTAAVSATPVATAPSAPSGLAATPKDASMTLTWTAPAGATGYRIYRNGTQVGTAATTTYTDTGLTNGTTYSWTVAAVKQNSAVSAQSASVSSVPVATAPSAPTGFAATPGDGSIALSWTAPAGADAFKVYRDGTLLASPATASYTDLTASNGVSHSYYVVAFKQNSAASPASSTVTSTAVAAAPSAPTGVTAAAGDTTVSLSWTAPAGATGYRVYRDGTLVGSPTSASFTDTGLTNGTTYSYTVRAVKQNSPQSTASSPVAATPVAGSAGAPTGLVGNPGDTVATLTWNVVPGATSYKVYRDGTAITTTAGNTWTDTGLANGTSYTYYVTALSGATESAASSSVFVTPVPITPDVPTGLSATPGDGSVALSWSASAHALSYKVYRDGVLVASPSTTSATVGSLTNGTPYSFTVVAVNGTASSAASSPLSATPVAAAPSAPTGLTATPGSTQVSLLWTAPAGATGYRVYRGGVLVASVATTSYTDTGLTNGTSYTWTVTAVKQNSAESAASSPATATPQVPAPTAPTGVTATAGANQVVVTWNVVSGATSYKLYRGATLVTTTAGNTYTETGLTAGTSVSYTVVAVNAGGSSAASSAATATPLPPAPTGLAVTPGNATNALSWTAVTGATGYRVYRNGTQVGTPSTTTYSDTGLTNGTSYSYYVVAVAGTALSTASSTVSGVPSPPLVNGTFTGATAAIAKSHGTLNVTLTVVNGVITVAKGTLLTNDGSETRQINSTALPKYDSEVLVAQSASIAKVSGATLTFAAYTTSLQSALTKAGL